MPPLVGCDWKRKSAEPLTSTSGPEFERSSGEKGIRNGWQLARELSDSKELSKKQ